MTPEFSRPLALDRISPEGVEIMLAADKAECAALAARMGLPEIDSLTCRFVARSGPGGTVEADGELRARLTQICIVSLDAFSAEVAEDFVIRFVPEGTEQQDPDLESADEITFTGTMLDFGEAASEQLALALDPYPRKPGAVLGPDAPYQAESPFARLAAFRRGR